MSYNLSATGHLSYTQQYVPQPMSSYSGSNFFRSQSDPIDQHSIYANSVDDVEPGHFVSFSNLQVETSIPQLTTVERTSDHAHVAGVVIEKAANPTDLKFINKNGVHKSHSISNHNHILRIARPGARVNAWVIDHHENELEGVYEKSINGTVVGQVIIRNVDSEHFSIETFGETNSLADEVADLRAKLEALTNN